jgi:hypothetical protein
LSRSVQVTGRGILTCASAGADVKPDNARHNIAAARIPFPFLVIRFLSLGVE